MSLYIDLKYINYISNRLTSFKRKNDYLFNFRCPICGDSSKKKSKARGYFYRIKNDMFMKCHNCSMSVHFGTFLKQLDQSLYSEYSFERYANEIPQNKPHREPQLTFAEPKVAVKPSSTSLLDKLLDRLDTLPDDHIAIKFCEKRMIPKAAYKRLYFIDNMKDMEQLSENARDKIATTEPRLVMPFYDENLQLTGVTCRALGNEKLRYIIVKVKEDVPLIFGIDAIDTKKHVYVTEGPIDSLFLPNAIAVSGTGFSKLDSIGIPKEKMTVIIDNQPRNKEVCKVYRSMIDKGYNVVVWPQSLEEKDVNDMILAGMSMQNLKKLIDQNTCSGLMAQANFTAWKRC